MMLNSVSHRDVSDALGLCDELWVQCRRLLDPQEARIRVPDGSCQCNRRSDSWENVGREGDFKDAAIAVIRLKVDYRELHGALSPSLSLSKTHSLASPGACGMVKGPSFNLSTSHSFLCCKCPSRSRGLDSRPSEQLKVYLHLTCLASISMKS